MFGNFAFKLTQIIQWITSVLNVMLQCYQEQIMACTGSQFYSIQFLDDKLSSRDCFTLRSWWHNALWETFHLGKWIMSHQCVGNYCVGKRNDLFFQTFETRDLRICWNRLNCDFVLSSNSAEQHNISCFFGTLNNTNNSQPHKLPLCAGLIHSCKFQQVCPITSGDVPLLAGAPPANPPLAMTNLLHKHPQPITINPTPGNTPQPQACTKTSFSITGESYCPTNLSFLLPKRSRLLNHYVLEFGFFCD